MVTRPRGTIEDLLSRVKYYWPEPDIERLRDAYEFAAEAHHDTPARLTGDPFITHPLAVGALLTEIEADPTTVVAGVLHDTVEDTDTELEDLESRFGPTVTAIVDGVTKLKRLQFTSKQEEQARNLRKMLLGMAQDPRVIIVKFADRLHNMRTLDPLSVGKRESTSLETQHIFAPLAHRLGIWRYKWELEDRAFRYLDSGQYYQISRLLGSGREEREHRINLARGGVMERLSEVGIRARVQGRAKHIYSIAQKIQKQDIGFEEIADLAAMRVITDSVEDCYGALGMVHSLWVPMRGAFTDYIATPKSNQYQSLHTKVIGPDKQPLEVQIRTWDMHQLAEYGVAAHWRYKEGRTDFRLDEQISALRQVLDLESDLSESHEFLELLQTDLFNDQVFVFTPDGDVVDLPAGAGPVDFAYRIHTEVGHRCVGARVNGRPVSLDYEFENGDIAEIVTSSTAEPSRDWLGLIKSSKAKAKVRRFLRAKMRDENIAAGRAALRAALDRHPPALRAQVNLNDLGSMAEKFSFSSPDDLLAAVGYGEVEADTVIRDLLAETVRPGSLAEEAQQLLPQGTAASASVSATGDLVSVDGFDGFRCRLSKCCSPLPGDEITGYITRGRGLTIHRSDCKNLLYRAESEPGRILPLAWSAKGEEATFRHDVEIVAVDRLGLLSHITAIISDCGINITASDTHTTEAGLAHLRLTVDIHRREDLDHVMDRLRQLIDVVGCRRLAPTR